VRLAQRRRDHRDDPPADEVLDLPPQQVGERPADGEDPVRLVGGHHPALRRRDHRLVPADAHRVDAVVHGDLEALL
jgi:hypothetical protein